MIDRSLDEAVSDLFAFSFVQFADPVNFLDKLFIILDMAGRILDFFLLLRLLLEHGEFQHFVLDVFLD